MTKKNIISFLTVVKLDAIGQGGFVLLETTALAMFVRWLVLYLYCVRNLISVIQSSDQNIKKAEHEEDVTRLDDHFVKDNAQEMPCASRHGKKELLEAFIIDVSQFSLVLVIEDGSGMLPFFCHKL